MYVKEGMIVFKRPLRKTKKGFKRIDKALGQTLYVEDPSCIELHKREKAIARRKMNMMLGKMAGCTLGYLSPEIALAFGAGCTAFQLGCSVREKMKANSIYLFDLSEEGNALVVHNGKKTLKLIVGKNGLINLCQQNEKGACVYDSIPVHKLTTQTLAKLIGKNPSEGKKFKTINSKRETNESIPLKSSFKVVATQKVKAQALTAEI